MVDQIGKACFIAAFDSLLKLFLNLIIFGFAGFLAETKLVK